MNLNNNLDIWENLFSSRDWGKYPPISLIRFIASKYYKFSNRKDIKILEIGCAIGANLWYLAHEGFTVYGIEYSPSALEKLKKLFNEHNLEFNEKNFYTGNYFELIDKFPDNYFDCIIDIESLSCNSFSSSREILSKCMNKLKVDSNMLSITFSDETFGLKDANEIDYHLVIPEKGFLVNIGEVRYTDYEDISKLYKFDNNIIENISKEEYIPNYRENINKISEWIISLRKTI